MSALVAATGSGDHPHPSPPEVDLPQATYLLLGSWVILLQGALILLFLPILVFSTKENIAAADIAMFGLAGVVSLVGGGILYLAHRWTWWVALAATVACSGYLLAVGGLTAQAEGYVATALAVAAVVLLVIGKRAAGNAEAH